SRRRHARSKRDWSSDVCAADLKQTLVLLGGNGGWVWERETGREQAIAGDQTSVCFSPDGRYALTGNKHDDTAQLWDLQTAEEREIGRASCREGVENPEAAVRTH